MMLYVVLDLLLINLIAYYLIYQVSLVFVILVIAIEITALDLAFVVQVPRYHLRW